MSNKSLKIAIIDDGISLDLFDCKSLKSVIINDDLSINSYNVYNRISHGTICANIIYKYYPNLDFYSIKVLSDNMKGKSDKLYRALDYCIEQKISIVHLSIGSCVASDFIDMQKKINETALKGLIIISAAHNENINSYPSCLSNVIGVKRDLHNELCELEFKFNSDLSKGIEFTSFAKHKIHIKEAEKICSNSNSYAAPMISALACDIYNKYESSLNVEQLKYKLLKKSVNYNNNYNFKYAYPDWIYKALVINASNKISFFRSIPASPWFNIVGSISDTNIEFDFIKYLKFDFDTVIVYNFDNNYLDYDYIFNICLNYKKNIVFLDSSPYFNLNTKLDSQLKIWHPSYSCMCIDTLGDLKTNFEELIIKIFFNEIWEITNLITLFHQSGYTVYCASDSPKGILYGLDYIPDNDINKVLFYISSKTQNTYYDIIILFIVNENTFSKLNADLSLYITDEQENYNVKVFENTNNPNFLQLKKDTANCFLYQKIINKFT